MSHKQSNKLIVIVGPTAVGKTDLTVKLGSEFHASVLNADSRQVYKQMNIGTAKPSREDRDKVKHYFVGTKNLKMDYNAGMFEREALELLNSLFEQTDMAILSGGSGLYIKSVCEGLDFFPEIEVTVRRLLKVDLKEKGLDYLRAELIEKDPDYSKEVDMGNPQRIIRALEVIRTSGKPFSFFRKQMPPERSFTTIKIGLDRPRPELYARINQRVDSMIEQGLFQEVEGLVEYRDKNALQTVGYQEIFGYLNGRYDKKEAIRLVKRNTRRFAKRQLTWFKKDPEITWFHPDQYKEILELIRERIDG